MDIILWKHSFNKLSSGKQEIKRSTGICAARSHCARWTNKKCGWEALAEGRHRQWLHNGWTVLCVQGSCFEGTWEGCTLLNTSAPQFTVEGGRRNIHWLCVSVIVTVKTKGLVYFFCYMSPVYFLCLLFWLALLFFGNTLLKRTDKHTKR